MEEHSAAGLTANPMIYAELCCNAESTREVDRLLSDMEIEMVEIPREGLFLAAKAHLLYRRRGGTKTSPLPDFFIGAHAETWGVPILTRDPGPLQNLLPRGAADLPLTRTAKFVSSGFVAHSAPQPAVPVLLTPTARRA
jgi:predicted nucleic acid-binding protein